MTDQSPSPTTTAFVTALGADDATRAHLPAAASAWWELNAAVPVPDAPEPCEEEVARVRTAVDALAEHGLPVVRGVLAAMDRAGLRTELVGLARPQTEAALAALEAEYRSDTWRSLPYPELDERLTVLLAPWRSAVPCERAEPSPAETRTLRHLLRALPAPERARLTTPTVALVPGPAWLSRLALGGTVPVLLDRLAVAVSAALALPVTRAETAAYLAALDAETVTTEHDGA